MAARAGDLLADGWFEWKKAGEKKQPYFIQRLGWSADIYGRY